MSTIVIEIYCSGVEIHYSLIERSIFERNNFNLYLSQQDLLTWQCRWSHISLDYVHMILAKPHQPTGSLAHGEIERNTVIPTVSATSTSRK